MNEKETLNNVTNIVDNYQAFKQLFFGKRVGYRTFVMANKGGIKSEAEYNYHRGEEVTEEDIRKHFYGEVGLAATPYYNHIDKKYTFACLDIDYYPVDIEKIDNYIIKKDLLGCFVCASKSKGAHIFYFPTNKDYLDEKELYQVSEILHSVGKSCGYSDDKMEFFPKSTNPAGEGNTINLPYFGAALPQPTQNFLVAGKFISFEQFTEYLEENKKKKINSVQEDYERKEPEEAKEEDRNMPFCIRKILDTEQIMQGKRTEVLFALASYYKMKGYSDWEDKTRDFCEKRIPDYTPRELEIHIIKPCERKTYLGFKCNVLKQMGFCSNAYESRCSFSKSSGAIGRSLTSLFTDLQRIVTDGFLPGIRKSVTWQLSYNNQRFTITDRELNDPTLMSLAVQNQLGEFWSPVKKSVWISDVLPFLFQNKLEDMYDPISSSSVGHAAHIFEQFIFRNRTESLSDLATKRNKIVECENKKTKERRLIFLWDVFEEYYILQTGSKTLTDIQRRYVWANYKVEFQSLSVFMEASIDQEGNKVSSPLIEVASVPANINLAISSLNNMKTIKTDVNLIEE